MKGSRFSEEQIKVRLGSPKLSLIVAKASGHRVEIDGSTLVADAIRELVEAARAGSQIRKCKKATEQIHVTLHAMQLFRGPQFKSSQESAHGRSADAEPP